ncbi:hypothetical protein EON83_08015 [bacterium]|nr:MAG: hypothetical protein EON83_08015 [bacterium]
MSPPQQTEFSEWLRSHPAFKESLPVVSSRELKGNQQLSQLEQRIRQLEQQLSLSQSREQQLASETQNLKRQIGQLTQDNNQLAHENHRQQSSAPSPLFAAPEDKELVIVTSQSKKFHRANCYYLMDVSPQFKTIKTKGEAIATGGRACRTCCP